MEEWDIQYKELLSMPEQSYRLIDIRDEASMSYGMIPGAEWLPTETIEQNLDAADKEKKLVLYCTRGALSEEVQKCSGRKDMMQSVWKADIRGGC